MYAEDDLIPISALQHMAFCQRQCALIHIEQVWAENRLTAEGRVMHARVHEAGSDARSGLRIVRGLRLRSLRFGLTGIADVVELHADPVGVCVVGVPGAWRVFPVEYKRGKPKHDNCDALQLCAQANCLEEMLSTSIPAGALFYGETHRRLEVDFSAALREQLADLTERTRRMLAEGRTPRAEYGPKCQSCSLLEICRPQTAGAGKSARRYLGQMLAP